jgi:hypothetical protein
MPDTDPEVTLPAMHIRRSNLMHVAALVMGLLGTGGTGYIVHQRLSGDSLPQVESSLDKRIDILANTIQLHHERDDQRFAGFDGRLGQIQVDIRDCRESLMKFLFQQQKDKTMGIPLPGSPTVADFTRGSRE